MVTKTQEELDIMRMQIQTGELPPDAIKQHFAAEEKVVFGNDFKKVKGQPVEQGIGSPGRENHNHFSAIRKYEGEDAYREAYEDLAKRDPAHSKKLNLPKPLPRKVG